MRAALAGRSAGPVGGAGGTMPRVTTPRPGFRALAALLGVAGALHLAVPRPFDGLVPVALGAPRPWVYGSGLAELACAAALLPRRSRAAAGWASAVLFTTVFPGNVTMAVRAVRSSRASPAYRGVALARLPLQAPLVWWAVDVARRAATPGDARRNPVGALR